MDDTIAAISTPLGKGAISIIRMSGKNSLQIARKVFDCKDFSSAKISPRRLYLGRFTTSDNLTEKCLCVYFKSPNSYTGEDLIEFQIHGGIVITQKILSTLLQSGARLASAGEFSRRAFENGKMSLDEAEAIIDEINAESESELKASLSAQQGRLKEKAGQVQNTLTQKIAEMEAALDYPEEDIEESTKQNLKNFLNATKEDIKTLLNGSQNARFIHKGVFVAIVGTPNVGKSSILNALLGENRAIVTDVAGTTRDTIEESTTFKGIKLNFVDTAGIHDTADKVEKIGVEKSKDALAKADIILAVFDGSKDIDKKDEKILQLIKDKNHIIVINKSDKRRVLNKMPNEICVSAATEENIESLKEIIYKKVIGNEINFSNTLVTNERQIAILHECENIIDNIDYSQSMDILAMQIKSLWNSLGKITGQCENEEIIDMIFTKFCLGK